MSCSLSSERLVKQKKKGGGVKNAMKRVEREETETEKEKEVRIEEEER